MPLAQDAPADVATSTNHALSAATALSASGDHLSGGRSCMLHDGIHLSLSLSLSLSASLLLHLIKVHPLGSPSVRDTHARHAQSLMVPAPSSSYS